MPKIALGFISAANRRLLNLIPTSTQGPSPTPSASVTPTPSITPNTTPTPSASPTPTPTPTATQAVTNLVQDSATSLQVWYDGADVSTIVPSAVDETDITQWTDKSNFAQNANPTGGNAKPSYENTVLKNGYGYVEFDGADGLSVNPFPELQSATNFTAFVVANCTSLLESKCLITTNGGDLRLVVSSTTTNVGMSGTNVFGSAGTSSNLNNWHMYTILYDGTKATNEERLIVRRNKINLYDSSSFTGTVPSTMSSTNTTLYVGQRADGTGKFIGYMAEIILFSRTLNNTELTNIENYLTSKWAL